MYVEIAVNYGKIIIDQSELNLRWLSRKYFAENSSLGLDVSPIRLL